MLYLHSFFELFSIAFPSNLLLTPLLIHQLRSRPSEAAQAKGPEKAPFESVSTGANARSSTPILMGTPSVVAASVPPSATPPPNQPTSTPQLTPEVQRVDKEADPHQQATQGTSDSLPLHSTDFSHTSFDGNKSFMEQFEEARNQNEEANRLQNEELASLISLKYIHTVSYYLSFL